MAELALIALAACVGSTLGVLLSKLFESPPITILKEKKEQKRTHGKIYRNTDESLWRKELEKVKETKHAG